MKLPSLVLLLIAVTPITAAALDVARAGLSYTFRQTPNDSSYRCMDVRGGKAKPNSVVQIYKCKEAGDNNYNQRWTLTGLNQLVSQGGICLDAYDKGGAIGSRLKMQKCNGSQFQKWSFEYPGSQRPTNWPNVYIKSSKGYCIGMAGGKLKDKTPLELMDCRRKKFVTWQQRRSQSALSGGCAKKVRKLNGRYLKDLGGANDFDVEQLCDANDNDALKTFTHYLDRTIDRFRTNTLTKARRDEK